MLSRKLSAAPGTSVTPSIAFVSNSTTSGVASTSHTFSSHNIGAADANRWVIVVAHYDGGSASTDFSGVNLAGGAMTLAVKAPAGDANVAIYYKKETSGTTANIEIQTNSNVDTWGVGVYRLITGDATPLVDSASGENAATSTLGNDEDGNAVIAGVSTQNGTTDPSISGEAAKDYDVDAGTNDYILGYHGTASTSTQSITGVAEGNEYHHAIASFSL